MGKRKGKGRGKRKAWKQWKEGTRVDDGGAERGREEAMKKKREFVHSFLVLVIMMTALEST